MCDDFSTHEAHVFVDVIGTPMKVNVSSKLIVVY